MLHWFGIVTVLTVNRSWGGKGVSTAVQNINDIIGPALAVRSLAPHPRLCSGLFSLVFARVLLCIQSLHANGHSGHPQTTYIT